MAQDIPISIQNFTKSYGDFRGVENVSFEINRGEVFGFLGPNGAGKSTTIRTLLNFIKPTSGKLEVFGLDSQKDSVAIKKHVGYLAGDIALYDTMTGQAIINYLSNLGKNTNFEYVDELVKRLDASMDRMLKSLS